MRFILQTDVIVRERDSSAMVFRSPTVRGADDADRRAHLPRPLP